MATNREPTHYGSLMLGFDKQSSTLIRLSEIEHYFNSDCEEVYMVVFPRTEHQSIIEFNPPRKWHPNFSRKMLYINIVEDQPILLKEQS